MQNDHKVTKTVTMGCNITTHIYSITTKLAKTTTNWQSDHKETQNNYKETQNNQDETHSYDKGIQNYHNNHRRTKGLQIRHTKRIKTTTRRHNITTDSCKSPTERLKDHKDKTKRVWGALTYLCPGVNYLIIHPWD